MRSKAEFRAMRETLGITQQRMADELCVKALSVKRWESPAYPQQAPDDAWELLDLLMEAQDKAVETAVDQVQRIEIEHEGKPRKVAIPYWFSQQDYDTHHHAKDGGRWTEVNATNRRLASVLRCLGYEVKWVDGRDNLVPRQKPMGN